MQAATMTREVAIDTEIAAEQAKLAKILRVIAREERYRDATDRYRSHYFDAEVYAEAQEACRKIQAAVAALVAQYTGWERYYHVTNANGHVHTTMNCATCYAETEFAWRTDLSGLTEAEVVAREAYQACTVCMPIAPAEQKAARERFNAAQRAAKLAERTAKADAKLKGKAERALKLLAKADAEVTKRFGGWDKLFAEYSLNGRDGRLSYYQASYEIPSQVADFIYDEFEERAGNRRLHAGDPRAAITEARGKGLIA